MDARFPEVADQLLLIERELRGQGLWSAVPPSAADLASREPFCVDTLRFEQWLQWVFLPRMKMILESNGPLPATSGIRPMAELAYAQRLGSLQGLIEALGRFDQLLQEE